MGRGSSQGTLAGVVSRLSGKNRREHDPYCTQELDQLSQEYFDKALDEGYPTVASAISQYIRDKEVYAESRKRLPKNWVDEHIRPDCEETYQKLVKIAAASKEQTALGREEMLDQILNERKTEARRERDNFLSDAEAQIW